MGHEHLWEVCGCHSLLLSVSGEPIIISEIRKCGEGAELGFLRRPCARRLGILSDSKWMFKPTEDLKRWGPKPVGFTGSLWVDLSRTWALERHCTESQTTRRRQTSGAAHAMIT